jgi:hypothetical protein
MVQLGVAHPQLITVLDPRVARDLRIGIASGRFAIPSVDIAIACTFGSLIAVLSLVVSGTKVKDPATLYAASMLRLVCLNAEEAEEVSHRPLPALTHIP